MHFPANWNVEANITPTRDSLGIPENAIVFFAGAAAAKYSYPMLDTWLSIIAQVPDSRLILYPFNKAWHPTPSMLLAFFIRLNLLLEKHGLQKERVIVMEDVNVGAIEAMHAWGDIYLNSFPYGGVTSMNDALRMGLPAICMTGKSARSNGDSAILDAYGFRDFIVTSRKTYIDLALSFAQDPALLRETKKKVKEIWERQHDSLDDHVATSYAALINEIAYTEFKA